MTPEQIEKLKAQIKAEIIEDIRQNLTPHVIANRDYVSVDLVYADEEFASSMYWHDFSINTR